LPRPRRVRESKICLPKKKEKKKEMNKTRKQSG